MSNQEANELQLAYNRLQEALKLKENILPSEQTLEQNQDGELILCNFMALAGEPITWVERRELWNDMGKTNNGKLPELAQTFQLLSKSSKRTLDSTTCTLELTTREDEENQINLPHEVLSNDHPSLVAIARGIKEVYNIRLSDDKSELKFVLSALVFLWTAVVIIIVCGHYLPAASELGSLSWAIPAEAFVLFFIELVWECFLSWIVLRYNIKINYTRKLGNLIKIPKYFMADFLPFYKSTALSMTASLAINQTLFCLMYYRQSREKFPFFSYIFLSQDRREDRPDTLTFQVTEDIMRFLVYIPFKLLVANPVGFPEIIFIPIMINNIGDGLAEPVGVTWGKHKYTTTALYYKGKFWNGQFTRSYEGSACVYFTTIVVLAANYMAFPSSLRFWITMALLPFLMTIAEAKAPHTNDGPFLALIGCGFLSAIFLI